MTTNGHRQIVLEIDGPRWTMTLADVFGRAVSIVECQHHEGVVQPVAVARWLSERDLAAHPIHVVVADGSVARFDIGLPRCSRKELREVLAREGRKAVSLDAGGDVRIAHRVRDRAGDGRTTYSVLALARSGAVEALIHSEVPEVASVAERNEAVLHALPAELPETLALVDGNTREIRFAYLESRIPRQERCVSLAGDPGGARASVADSLAIEIPRTLDYLAELGLSVPQAIAFSPSLGLDQEAMQRAAPDQAVLDLLADDWDLPEGSQSPGLATLGVLRQLSGVAGLTVLQLSAPTVSHLGTPVWGALAVLLSMAGVVGHFGYGAKLDRAQRLIEERTTAIDALWSERARLDAGLGDGVPSASVGAGRRGRRPASLLFAEVSRRVPAGVVLHEIAFTEEDDVRITGSFQDGARHDAARSMGAFLDALSQIPFLRNIRENVDRQVLPTGGSAAVFVVNARWRL